MAFSRRLSARISFGGLDFVAFALVAGHLAHPRQRHVAVRASAQGADVADPLSSLPAPLMALPGLVRAHREAKGLSLHDLSKLCGLSVSALSAIERGHVANLRVKTLLQLGHGLGVPAAVLLGEAAPLTAREAEFARAVVAAHRRLWPEAR